jgi:hypothetical protein
MDDVLCNANFVMWIHDGLPRIVNCMHNGNPGWLARVPTDDHGKIILVMWAIWMPRSNTTHDKGSLDKVQSTKMMKDALTMLELPRQHARIFMATS